MREPTDEEQPAEVLRSEETLDVSTVTGEAGTVRFRKVVDHEAVAQHIPVDVERADVERATPSEGDSGQVETLPDGSISIPVFEERLVIEKRLVVRERVEVEADDAVADRVDPV